MRTILALLVTFLIGAALLSAERKTPTDDMLVDQVRLKLAADRDVGGENIKVNVNEGVVELQGTVRKESSRSKAEKIAKKVKGVHKVVNQLKVGSV